MQIENIPFNTLDEFLEKIKTISVHNKIYIWGISIYGNLLGRLFNERRISWIGYYDNFNDIEESQLNFKPVYKNIEIDTSKNAIYILAMRNYDAVKKQLLSEGVKEKNILYFDNTKILEAIEEVLTGYVVSTDLLKTFKNKHKGEACFIVGNGPSLCTQDLDIIYKAGICSFACNLIFKCYSHTLWRPDYYFFTDGIGIRKTFKDKDVLQYAAQNCKYMFSRSNGELAEYKDVVENLILFKQVFSDSEQKFDFSEDCAEKVYTGYTVTYVMLQLAAYMGFEKIYLLGMDHTFSIELDKQNNVIENQNISNHAKILGDYSMWGIPDTIKTSLAYASAKRYADSKGIKIYNATRGGRLEIFERKNFDKLF